MWKLVRLQVQLILVSVLSFLCLPFLPMSNDFEPVAYNVSLPEFEGKLAINNLLDKGKMLFQTKLRGPESLAVKDGIIYTGTRLGDVWAFDPAKDTVTKIANTGSDCKGLHDEQNCGRVLGLRFANNGDLYGIDAYKGLQKIDIKTGKVETLVKNGAHVGNAKLLFGDDLDIDDNGIIYYSQGSKRWGLHQIIYIVMEYDTTGRILTYDTKTKKSGVLLDNLAFPNGVQLTPDKKSLLFSELNQKRIMRYELQGPKKGELSVFADKMPGGPDNIRLSPRGTYWVGIDSSRSSSTPYIGDLIAPYPLVGKATIRFSWIVGQVLKTVNKFYEHPTIRDLASEFETGMILMRFVPPRGIIVELSKDGEVIRALHSTHVTLFSEVLEMNQNLYIGSFINPFLFRVPLPK